LIARDIGEIPCSETPTFFAFEKARGWPGLCYTSFITPQNHKGLP
jgi:hypothetical protein